MNKEIKSLIIGLMCFMLTSAIKSQEVVFEVEASTDTILLGNVIEIKYSIKNIQGEFSPPDFGGMVLVGGPNSSNQYSMINGKVTQSSSYSYILQPITKGTYQIAEAELVSNNKVYRSPGLSIVALANPEGKVQQVKGFKVKNSDLVIDSLFKSQSSDTTKVALPKLKTRKI